MTVPMQQTQRYGAVAPKTDANPEGKGVNGLLADWGISMPRGVVAKPQPQILAEFFTSMLVLSAEFRYRPVVHQPNYLYWINGRWMLSLIAPEEWSDERRAGFAGTCMLQPDRTWTINPSRLLARDTAVARATADFYTAFAEIMDTDVALEEVLPVYVAKMPYYQRLGASALSRSIRQSLSLGDQRRISCCDWQLPGLPRLLPHDAA